ALPRSLAGLRVADGEAVAALGAAALDDAAAGLRRHARAEAVLVGALAAAGLVGSLHRSGGGCGARDEATKRPPGGRPPEGVRPRGRAGGGERSKIRRRGRAAPVSS